MKKGLHKCTMKNEYMLYEYIHSNPHLAPTEVREQKFAITCSMCIDCHKFRWTNSGAILALDTRVYAYKYKYIYVCVCVCVYVCVQTLFLRAEPSTVSNLRKGSLPETFSKPEICVKSTLASPPLIYYMSAVMYTILQRQCSFKIEPTWCTFYLNCLLLFSTCFGHYVPIIRRNYGTYATSGVTLYRRLSGMQGGMKFRPVYQTVVYIEWQIPDVA